MKGTTGFHSQILDSMEQRKLVEWRMASQQRAQPEREKQISYDITYMLNLYTYTYIYIYE